MEFLIKKFLPNKGIHGFKYLSNRPIYEKFFWVIFIVLAIIGAVFNIYQVWIIYGFSQTRTTIVNTYYKYENVAFPSITVCDSTRVDWKKALEIDLELSKNNNFAEFFENKFSSKKSMLNLLSVLSTIQFGASKDLEDVKKLVFSRKMKEINISKLLLKLVRPCKEFFGQKCWWRNRLFNCCDLFELQKTGYGFCYSFNSDISEKSRILSLNYGLNGDTKDRWTDWNQNIRPRRSAGHGFWSALRITVNSQKIPSFVNSKPGIIVIIGDPSGFPFENDIFVPTGRLGSIGVWGDAVITTARLQNLSPKNRHCLFPDDARILHRGYLRQNCIADCYRIYMEKNCNCSLDFIYYTVQNDSTFQSCNVEHLKCLSEYNYAFNNHLAVGRLTHSRGAFCKCPDDCKNQKYVARLSLHGSIFNPEEVICDIHFERSFCTLYRTDVVFDILDVLIRVGSIFGLFLGASLLSISEVIYTSSFKIISFWRNKFFPKAILEENSKNNQFCYFLKRELKI